MPTSLNRYGDHPNQYAKGYGCDIASQRADDLDLRSVEVVHNLIRRGKEVWALDVGCGIGGHTVRLAAAGAKVIGIDLGTPARDFFQYCDDQRVTGNVQFIQADMKRIDEAVNGKQFHILYSQRSIHYLPWCDALTTVRKFYDLLVTGGQIFLSASGLDTPLGKGYMACNKQIEDRFAPLAEDVATSDKINYPVTLYKPDELERLLNESGFESVEVHASEFGNIKGYGRKPV